MKPIRPLNVVFSFLFVCFFWSCKSTEQPDEVVVPVEADSSSIAAVAMACKSSDAATSAILVANVQHFFLKGKIVESTIKGKVISIRLDDEPAFVAAVGKIIADFQHNDPYFKNYDRFDQIFEDQFKVKTGYLKSYEIGEQQIEKLFNKEEVTLANLEQKRNSMFANVMFLSSGFGGGAVSANRTLAGDQITLKSFVGAMDMGSKFIGVLRNYGWVKNLIIDPAAIRNAIENRTTDVFVSSYDSGGYLNSYAYRDPMVVFGAPVWYWHKFTDPTYGFPAIFPPNGYYSSFEINNFGNSSIPLDVIRNTDIANGVATLAYGASDSGAEIGSNQLVDPGKGWESTFSFTAEAGQRVFVRLRNPVDKSNRYFGIFTYPSGANGVTFFKNELVRKIVPPVFDGRIHKIKIICVNKPDNSGARAEIYLDDMSSPIYVSEDPKNLGALDSDARIFSVGAFDSPESSGKYKIHSWSLKTY